MSELIIEGLVYGLNGFGEALRNIVLGLNELGVKIQIVPKGSQKSRLPEHLVETLESLSKGGGNYETSPYLYFGLPCGPHKKSSVCNIAYVMFEAQSLTVDSVDKCNQMDWIWVPTTFCRDLFVSGGVNPKKIKVVPLGVDVDRFSPEASRIKFLPGSFKFLSVMDWSTRKGADLLIEAYLEEFNIEDNASLLIKIPANAKKRALNDIRVIKKKILKTNQPPIYLCCQTLPLADMPSLYNSVNAFVLPSRGEGWCTIPEAQILTSDGMKQIQSIKTGEKVLTHKNAYKIANHVFRRRINENLIVIQPHYTFENFKLTKEHPVLIVRSRTKGSYQKRKVEKGEIPKTWLNSGNLKKGDFLLVPRIEKVISVFKIELLNKYYKDGKIYILGRNQFGAKFIHPNSHPIPQEIKITPAFLRLCGAYIAEGCPYHSGVSFSLNSKETKYRNQIIKDFQTVLGHKTTYRIYKTTRHRLQIFLNNKMIGEFFGKYFGKGAHNKQIPECLIYLPFEQIRHLLNGMFTGDGHLALPRKNKNAVIEYSTVSERLAIQTKTILWNCGILCSLQKKSNRTEYVIRIHGKYAIKLGEAIGWKVPEMRKKTQSCGLVFDKYLLIPIKETRKEKYSGTVYNLETEKDNSYTINSFAVHNCLPIVEAMATALPVITTGDGSIMDYANQKNAFLIENNGYAKCPSTEWIHQDYKNKEFACPDLEHLKKLMRFVYKNKDKAIEKGKRARETMTKKFTWNKSCRRMKRLLKDISDGKNSNKKTTS